ncbi:phospholipid hydroperoxide glutathione peroxidase [Pyrus ussuriensis x Pyrus communis]|uniref:Phospholipid hydroperoxide glutathione peroxidase n=1 Tax=Pyrus ussuriensis x Pyrus communis TaxID=2448454 RepID=A0A5N5G2B5_9ROSA|nr:phospholipid hydroperoxide glutathione peroxidase [Pyrus ussuriensis x Pyrus communis]
MCSLKFTNWVSLFFLGFAFFRYFYTSQFSSPRIMAEESSKSVYEFTVKDIHGNDVNLSEYSGKVVVIANVASKYLTQSNFKELSVSYGKYKNKDFEILAQETMRRFKAEFPLFDKIEVNGKNEVPLYRFLKGQKGGIFGSGIQWNFNKFLGNKEGKVVERYAPVTLPIKIEKDIQNLFDSSSLSRTAGSVWFGIQKIKRVCR